MRRRRSNSSLLQAGDEAGTLRVPDIQKSCFRGFIGFWFFCLVVCSLLPGFSAAGSIFYKSVCDLWCFCAVCAIFRKFNVVVCVFECFCGCFCEIIMVFVRCECRDGRREGSYGTSLFFSNCIILTIYLFFRRLFVW